MGVYASWIEDLACHKTGIPRGGFFRWLTLLARIASGRGQRRANPRRTLVLSDFEPTHQQIMNHFGQAPARMVLPVQPRMPFAETTYGIYETGTNPVQWDADTDAAIPRDLDAVATFLSWSRVHGKTLRAWWQAGIRRCWFVREQGKVGIPPLWAFLAKMAEAGWRAVRRTPPSRITIESCRQFLTLLNASPRPPSSEMRRITHFIGSLSPGGAERQVCNTAVTQKQAGYDVRVVLQTPPLGRSGHYLPLLEEAEIPVRCAGMTWRESFRAAWARRRLNLDALWVLPQVLRRYTLDFAAELLIDPPDVLHCWLDQPNIVGLLAAQVAGVPRVLLSLRAVSPAWCPRLLMPWMKPWYQVAADLPGVGIVANSEAGARDYESWLGLARDAIGVLRNSFVPPPQPDPAEVARFRQEHNLTPATPVVACVFRLDTEKRPLLVLNLLAQVRELIPGLRVLMVGCGPLEGAVRAEVRRLGMENTVHLLGQRKDVPVILAASGVLLLASEVEGTPNVALEAQHFGCVPVLTDAGGSREAIIPDQTGLLRDMNDGPGLVSAIELLLRDPKRRAAMTHAGRNFVAQRFDPRCIHEQTLAAYAALHPATPTIARAA